jgi:hypothetical protein
MKLPAISPAIIFRHVVFARHAVDFAGAEAAVKLIHRIELLRLGQVRQVTGVQDEGGPLRQGVDLGDGLAIGLRQRLEAVTTRPGRTGITPRTTWTLSCWASRCICSFTGCRAGIFCSAAAGMRVRCARRSAKPALATVRCW